MVRAVTPEAQLTRCARCGADADGDQGHAMYGVLVEDLGSVPIYSVVRAVAKTRLLIRLRLCNDCTTEARAFAVVELTAQGVPDALEREA